MGRRMRILCWRALSSAAHLIVFLLVAGVIYSLAFVAGLGFRAGAGL
jgi:hypothetical protein